MNLHDKRTVPLSLLCMIAVLMTSCTGSTKTTTKDSSISGQNITDSDNAKAIARILESKDLDEELREILQTKNEEPPKTSYDLIENDFDSGVLKREEAVLLKLTAAYYPEKLDAKYRVADSGNIAPDSDFLRRDLLWIMNNFKRLDAALQKKLKPFILKPDDPDSFYNPANKKKEETLLQKLSLNQAVFAEEQPWQSISFAIAGMNVTGKIYYYENELTADGIPMKQKAADIKSAIEKAWPMYKALLHTEPVLFIPVYLTDLKKEKNSLAGVATCLQDEITLKPTEYRVNIERTLSGDSLKSVAAHELFHIFQYHIMREYNELESWWLQEATAVWAEDYVYPLVNREHGFLNVFFGNLDAQFIDKGFRKEYAGYMLFFFLSERFRDSRYVADTIINTKGYDVAKYMMNAFEDFPDTYAEFASWNWNAKPWKKYSDNNTFPSKRPMKPALQNLILENATVLEDEVILPAGAIGYRYYHIADNNTKRVKFDFTDVEWDGDLHIQALYKVGDQWTTRDCTDLPSVVFCRDKPSEKVKGIVLIFSNADLATPTEISKEPPVLSKEPLQIRYEVDTTGECPKTISGYTKITETMTYRNGNQSAGMVINYYSDDELMYDEERDAYVITKRSLKYSLSADKNFPDMAVFGLGGNDTTGSGSLVEIYDIHDAPIRFQRTKNGEGYLVPDPDTDKSDWVKYNDTVLGAYDDIPIGIAMIYLGATGGIDVMADEIKDGIVKGNRSSKASVDSKMDMETTIEFSYNLGK